eukprot:312654_1
MAAEDKKKKKKDDNKTFTFKEKITSMAERKKKKVMKRDSMISTNNNVENSYNNILKKEMETTKKLQKQITNQTNDINELKKRDKVNKKQLDDLQNKYNQLKQTAKSYKKQLDDLQNTSQYNQLKHAEQLIEKDAHTLSTVLFEHKFGKNDYVLQTKECIKKRLEIEAQFNTLSQKRIHQIRNDDLSGKNMTIKSQKQMIQKSKKTLATNETKSKLSIKYYASYLSDEYPLIGPNIIAYNTFIANIDRFLEYTQCDIEFQITTWCAILIVGMCMTYIGYLNSTKNSFCSFLKEFYINYLVLLLLIGLTTETPLICYMDRSSMMYLFLSLTTLTLICLIIKNTDITEFILSWKQITGVRGFGCMKYTDANYEIITYPDIDDTHCIKSQICNRLIISNGINIFGCKSKMQNKQNEEEIKEDGYEYFNQVGVFHKVKDTNDTEEITGMEFRTNKSNTSYIIGTSYDENTHINLKRIKPPSEKRTYTLLQITFCKDTNNNSVIGVQVKFIDSRRMFSKTKIANNFDNKYQQLKEQQQSKNQSLYGSTIQLQLKESNIDEGDNDQNKNTQDVHVDIRDCVQ